LAGLDLHDPKSYFFSLGFTLFAAFIFAVIRSKRRKIPQEAFIGIVYAVSAAASILIMDRLPEGGEHIKQILVGNLLAVTPFEIAKIAIIYGFLGLLHWFWRKPLLAISTDYQGASEKGLRIRLWDFLFYATFGIVVTSSVAIAGVLLVFSFLIVPPVSAMLFFRRVGPRLAFGWVMGAVVSFLGIYGSYRFDTPTGATVVCMFGLGLLLLSGLLLTGLIKRDEPDAFLSRK
jgi:zinc/manganese transport system permease protein